MLQLKRSLKTNRCFVSARSFVACLLLLACLLGPGCSPRSDSLHEVVLYSSVDESYSREVAAIFEKRTGIRVRLVSDTEATKSTGLINRLIAERERPVADVFWSGDIMRAYFLKEKGIAAPCSSAVAEELPATYRDPGGFYAGSAARLRLILCHTNSPADGTNLPASVTDLARPAYARRSCLANPLFGTTSMHAAALFEHWGEVRAKRFFEEFAKNGGRMLASNGEVRRRVASGEFTFGVTDSDDVSVALFDKKPVTYVIPDQQGDGAVLVPSAAVLIRGAPHEANARKLVDFLASAEVEEFMAGSDAAHFPLRSRLKPPTAFGFGVAGVKLMSLDYARLARRQDELQRGFLKQWVEQQQR